MLNGQYAILKVLSRKIIDYGMRNNYDQWKPESIYFSKHEYMHLSKS